MTFSRRTLMASGGAALAMTSTLARSAAPRGNRFSWDHVVARAQRLAAAPFRDTPPDPAATKIGYDAVNRAPFRPERTIWADGDDHGIRLFPLSGTSPQPVAIHLVENGVARPLLYDPSFFALPPNSPLAGLGPQAGYAGFRVMNAAGDGDWLAFMGASYFRASGAQNQYGLSARAVSIATSTGPEEFPRFTTFWLERTEKGLVVHALLDGPSIAGAFRFVCNRNGDGVAQDVTAALFPRTAIPELGLMPMSSMFWYDQAHRAQAIDWRPEIHDSDGLEIVEASGARSFRPLVNPLTPRTDRVPVADLASFGLLQRDRDFDHYQDDGVFYDRRPSLWVTPRILPGPGKITLYAFTAGNEYADNIASYWTPDAAVPPGKRIDAAYRLDWRSAPLAPSPLASLIDLRRGVSNADAGQSGAPLIRLVADFAGGDITAAQTGQLSVNAQAAGGTIVKTAAYPILAKTGAWRMVLDIAPKSPTAGQTIETVITAWLERGGRPVGETIVYPLL